MLLVQRLLGTLVIATLGTFVAYRLYARLAGSAAARCEAPTSTGSKLSPYPDGIVRGPDGRVWFASGYDGLAGSIDVSGRISLCALHIGTGFPMSMGGTAYDPIAVAGGKIWLTDTTSLVALGADGKGSRYALPAPLEVADIAPGFGGDVWFIAPGYDNTGAVQSVLGRRTAQGAITLHPLPRGVRAYSLTAGPGAAIWVLGDGAIVRVGADGAQRRFPAPIGDTFGAGRIVVAADGNLWFVQRGRPEIGRMTPAGALTVFPINGKAMDLALGPRGNLWWATARAVGRIGLDGAAHLAGLPSRRCEHLAVGADDAAWCMTATGIDPRIVIIRVRADGRTSEYTAGPKACNGSASCSW